MDRSDTKAIFLTGLILSLALFHSAAQAALQSPNDSERADQVSALADSEEPLPLSALVPNGRVPYDGLLTGGQPSPEQISAIADRGFKTVINLRTEAETPNTNAAYVESLGMVYIAIPIGGAEDLNEENAASLAEALDDSEQPILLHCGSGNRVGALIALKAYYVDGATAEEALELGLDAGMTRLEPVVREKLGLPQP
ncbi:MAG: sulfur transferase domain-containing protein [Acidobacteriota bacterium]